MLIRNTKSISKDSNFRQRIINFCLIFLYFIFQAVDNSLREKYNMVSDINDIKNYYLLAISLYFLAQIGIHIRNNIEVKFCNELVNICLFALVASIFSLYYINSNRCFNFVTVEGIIRILLPVFFSFCVLNIVNSYDISLLFKSVFWLMFFSYLLSKSDSLQYFSPIFWNSSASPTESNFFSPIAIALCSYFCLVYRQKLYIILSFIFVILTFKRLMIVFAFFWVFFGGKIHKARLIPKSVIYLFGIIFALVSWIYYRLLSGDFVDIFYDITGQNINEFTMGRSFFMRNAISGFKSCGLYSSTVNHQNMEMDIPMIYIELGPIVVICLIFFILKLAGRYWSVFSICIFILLEMLTSHWIDITSYWILAYICIGCIKYSKNTFKNKLR